MAEDVGDCLSCAWNRWLHEGGKSRMTCGKTSIPSGVGCWTPKGCLDVFDERPGRSRPHAKSAAGNNDENKREEQAMRVCRHCGKPLVFGRRLRRWWHDGGESRPDYLWCVGTGKDTQAEPVPEGCLVVTSERPGTR